MPLTIVVLIALLAAVSPPTWLPSGRTPVVFVDVGDPRLEQEEGRWFFEGAPFTGIVRDHAPSGSVAAELPLLDGRPHGLVRHWFEDGRLERAGVFWRGAKVGRHRAWWRDGTLRFEAAYRDDAYHGSYRTWYEGGQPYELRHFDHGREAGLQRSWTEDGQLYLNYEVRDGRRYGYINAKPCLPVTGGLS